MPQATPPCRSRCCGGRHRGLRMRHLLAAVQLGCALMRRDLSTMTAAAAAFLVVPDRAHSGLGVVVSCPARGGNAALSLAPREQQAEWPNGGDGSDAPPPCYDGSKLARDVFAHPYFYRNSEEAKEREAFRSSALGDRLVRDVFRDYFDTDKVRAIESLGTAIRARTLRIRKFYYSGEAAATRQAFASEAVESTFECEFRAVVLPFPTINEALLPLLPVEANVGSEADSSFESRTMDMSFLEALRVADEEEGFLVPDKIYVRNCMRRVFGLFHEDAVRVPRREPDKAYSAALIGSPGVGKSILFFLAALDRARTSNVVYFRKSGEEPLSLFVMTPETDGRNVRIWFTRSVARRFNNGLSTIANTLEDCRILQRSDFYYFVDGPKYGDIADTFDGDYDYFCTSGGFRRYKNEEQKKRLWVLDGWTEDEAVTALVALNSSTSPSAAKEAYFLCGGVIRDMLQACSSSDSFADVKRRLDELVEHCDKESVELVFAGTEGRGDDPSNPDRLRTMFELRASDGGSVFREKNRMGVCHVVDSPFLIEKLYATLPRETWQKAYDQILWWASRGSDPVAVIERLFTRTSFLD